MMDASTPLGMLVENMEYIPDILPAMMTFMNSEEGVRTLHEEAFEIYCSMVSSAIKVKNSKEKCY